jgi:hypothetical protein
VAQVRRAGQNPEYAGNSREGRWRRYGVRADKSQRLAALPVVIGEFL